MREKNLWRWILTVLADDVLLKIFKDSKMNAAGFRINKIQDVKTHRNHIINIMIHNKNYKNLKDWANKFLPKELMIEDSLKDKEVNELVELVRNNGVVTIFLTLFNQNLEKRAIQLYAFLKDTSDELLDIPNASINLDGEKNEEKNDTLEENSKEETNEIQKNVENTSKQDKLVKKLTDKIDRLKVELQKKDEMHKKKSKEEYEKHQVELKKLIDKIEKKGALVNEKCLLIEELENKKRELILKNNELEKINFDYLEELKNLRELNKLKESEEKVVDTYEQDLIEVLIIGKPALEGLFKGKHIHFSFFESSDIEKHIFHEEYDEFWILKYELSRKEQMLLRKNESFLKINKDKVKEFQNFYEAKEQIKKLDETVKEKQYV